MKDFGIDLKNIVCRLSYAKKYYNVLIEVNAQGILPYLTEKDYK